MTRLGGNPKWTELIAFHINTRLWHLVDAFTSEWLKIIFFSYDLVVEGKGIAQGHSRAACQSQDLHSQLSDQWIKVLIAEVPHPQISHQRLSSSANSTPKTTRRMKECSNTFIQKRSAAGYDCT